MMAFVGELCIVRLMSLSQETIHFLLKFLLTTNSSPQILPEIVIVLYTTMDMGFNKTYAQRSPLPLPTSDY